jgi:hypothetical protein
VAPVKKSKPDEAYEREMHEAALSRDRERRETRHPCCWELHGGPHHPLCRNAEQEPSLEQVPGQESLL